MRADCFLDTNILVYLVDSSEESRKRKQVAGTLVETKDFGLSVQVIQEFYVTVTRKLEKPLSPEQAVKYLEQFHAFPLVATDPGLVLEGIRNSLKFQVSYWDGAIIAAAQRLEVRTLYSEDLSHEQRYGEIQVINPFL